jgi:hypothetical protein
MAELRSGHEVLVERDGRRCLRQARKRPAYFGSVGIMVVENLTVLHHSAYVEAIELLLPVRLISCKSAAAIRNVTSSIEPWPRRPFRPVIGMFLFACA